MGVKIKDVLLIIVSFIIAVFVMPLAVLFLFLPLFVFRQTIIKLASCKSDLYLPLNLSTCFSAWDDLYVKPLCSVAGAMYLTGGHDFKVLTSRIESVLKAKHPEMRCTMTRWMCTSFWKKCPTFQISNHIVLNEESDPDKIKQILNSLPEKPYKKGQPLWEVISFPNHINLEYGTKSTILVRMHHVLGDGFAYIKLAHDLCDPTPNTDEDPLNKYIKPVTQTSTVSKVSKFFQLIFITPTETVYNLLKAVNYNPLTLDSNEQSGEMVRVYDMSSIDITYLKRISKKTGTNITAIMYASVTAALRNVIIEKGGHTIKDISSLYVLPLPRHPGTMTNQIFFIPVTASISEKRTDQRLINISNQFKHILNSTLPNGQIAFFGCLGLLFAVLGKEVSTGNFGSYMHSNFAVLGEPVKVCGNVVERFVVMNGLQRSANSLLVITVSYNGKMGIVLQADKTLFPDENSLSRVMSFIQNELNELNKISSTLVNASHCV